ncbi:MAG: hypothetical protein JW750_02030 [Anaerolineaceae bacterium]|nr:hypothetical protein [Anaerolineaceae bacterium]
MKKIFQLTALLVVLAMLLAACGAGTPDTSDLVTPVEEVVEAEEPATDEEAVEETEAVEEPEEEAVSETTAEEPAFQYQEAPMLAEMVAAGDLPPLEERLPEVPFMVGPGTLIIEEDLPDWTSGEYGGTLQMAHFGNFPPDVFIGMNEGYLAGRGVNPSGAVGDVFESYEVSADNTTFTFYLRKGLRWSDGVPVTREDIEFAWFDVLNNKELNPGGVPGKWRTASNSANNPGVLEFTDDWTFTLTFDGPYGGLTREMSFVGWVGYTDLVKPAHYLKLYHKDYAEEDDLLALIEEAGYSGLEAWVNCFNMKDVTNWEAHLVDAIGFPQLYPWVLTEMTEGALVYTRNPYYYKVDIEGKQLPYIDQIITARVDEVEMVNMRAIAGDVDFTRESPDIQQIAVYRENEAAGNYTARIYQSHNTGTVFTFNFVSTDEAWNEVINDLRFRQALNYAIDTDEINNTIYFGLATNSPARPSEFDLDQANTLLDEMGMTEYDADGFRKTPSGLPLTIYINTEGLLVEHAAIAELCSEYWAEIGLKTVIDYVSRDLEDARRAANELMIDMTWRPVTLWKFGTQISWLPDTPEWDRYMNKVDEYEGVQPPPEAARLWELQIERNKVVGGSPEDVALYDEIIQSMNDHLWMLPLVVNPNPLIISNDLRNIPSSGIAIAANYSMEQFYFVENRR